jgi:hypothetical protein
MGGAIVHWGKDGKVLCEYQPQPSWALDHGNKWTDKPNQAVSCTKCATAMKGKVPVKGSAAPVKP